MRLWSKLNPRTWFYGLTPLEWFHDDLVNKLVAGITTDEAIVYLDLQIASVEIFETVDAATVTIGLQASGTDTAQFVELDQVYIDIQPSSTEEYTRHDAATVPVVLTTSSDDIAQFVDAQTVGLLFSPSATDELVAVETVTVPLDFEASGTEFMESSTFDEATISLALSLTSVEIAEFTEVASVPLLLTPSGAEIFGATDLTTVYLDLQASGTEELGLAPQILRPNADVATDAWADTPLHPKISDESNATFIFAAAI